MRELPSHLTFFYFIFFIKFTGLVPVSAETVWQLRSWGCSCVELRQMSPPPLLYHLAAHGKASETDLCGPVHNGIPLLTKKLVVLRHMLWGYQAYLLSSIVS